MKNFFLIWCLTVFIQSMAFAGHNICLSVYQNDSLAEGSFLDQLENKTAQQLVDFAYPVLISNYHSSFVGSDYLLAPLKQLLKESSALISKELQESSSTQNVISAYSSDLHGALLSVKKESDKRRKAWIRKSFENSRPIRDGLKSIYDLQVRSQEISAAITAEIEKSKDDAQAMKSNSQRLDKQIPKINVALELISQRMEREGLPFSDAVRVRGGAFGTVFQGLLEANLHQQLQINYIRTLEAKIASLESQKLDVEKNNALLFSELLQSYPELKPVYEKIRLKPASVPAKEKPAVVLSRENTQITEEEKFWNQAHALKGTGKGTFIKVPPGNFLMGTAKNNVIVVLKKNIEMSSTHTTQQQWTEVFSIMGFGNHSLKKGIDLPVHNVSRAEINDWLAILNTLSRMDHSDTQAALVKMFPGHFRGAVYRLPTEAEWEYVAKNRSGSTNDFPNWIDRDNLQQFSVLMEDSIQPVGSRLPLIFMDQPIYDMLGNASEIVAGNWSQNLNELATKRLSNGQLYLEDPVTIGNDRFVVFRGGNYLNSPIHVSITGRFHGPDIKSGLNSFRLVRERPNELFSPPPK